MDLQMTFEQLLKKAAEEANEHELVTITISEIRSYLDSIENQLEELDGALDWAQGAVHSGESKEAWVLIKVVS
jgi:hypothetical protein